ncbi:Ig-like domain-containing protein [Acinetobacter soli]
MADGAHSITTTATDAAGNTSAASDALNFTVDTTNDDWISTRIRARLACTVGLFRNQVLGAVCT